MDNHKDWLLWFEYAENDFEKIIVNCSDLTIYSSEVRYPNVLEIEDYHMKSAIKDAVMIKEFVLTKLAGLF